MDQYVFQKGNSDRILTNVVSVYGDSCLKLQMYIYIRCVENLLGAAALRNSFLQSCFSSTTRSHLDLTPATSCHCIYVLLPILSAIGIPRYFFKRKVVDTTTTNERESEDKKLHVDRIIIKL